MGAVSLRESLVQDQTSTLRQNKGTVLYYSARPYEPSHEKEVHAGLAEQLAALLDMDYGGEHTATGRDSGPVYLLPTGTLIGMDQAIALGVQGEQHLFGGVVPYAFVCTKAISHPLISGDARAPQGWSHEFARRVSGSVLKGYSAFTTEDARIAGLRLLEEGALRIKPVNATAGRGQTRVADEATLEQILRKQDEQEIRECGLVLEQNLDQVQTYSVGQVRVGNLQASYVGTQRLTPDNAGEMVYGGSDLIVARGDFEALLSLDLHPDYRHAIAEACIYDRAASDCFPGFFASRRNYDTVRGVDSHGVPRSGVLEQSWRVGGASTAEMAALIRFRLDPALMALRAATYEYFGEQKQDLPAEAQQVFSGVDPDIGLIHKYVTVTAYGNQ